MGLVFGHVIFESVGNEEVKILNNVLFGVLVVDSLMATFIHFSEAHRIGYNILVVKEVFVIGTYKVLILIKYCQNFNKLKYNSPFLNFSAKRTKINFFITVRKKVVSGLNVLIAIFMNPFSTELSRTLCPSSISFFFADMTDFICLLCLVAITTLITTFHKDIIKIFKLLLTYFTLYTVLTEVSITINRILLHFKFAAYLMKHITALHAGDALAS